MWGILVALLNYVPYFGAVGGVVILVAVGLLTFDSPWRGLLPPLWYLVLHLLEANFVTPTLLGRRFTLNPVAIFVSLIFWVWLWGVPGALLSVPILVSVKVVCDRIPAPRISQDDGKPGSSINKWKNNQTESPLVQLGLSSAIHRAGCRLRTGWPSGD